MTVAGRWATLRVILNQRLHEWTLQAEHCIKRGRKLLIPASMWHTALPVWRAAVVRTEDSDWHELRQKYERRAEVVQQEQPTTWVTVELDALGSWKVVDHESVTEQSADVQRVEVLRDLHLEQLENEVVPSYSDVDVRCRSILQACPYLQCLKLEVDAYLYRTPSNADTFAIVPRLRILCLKQEDSDRSPTGEFDFRSMLDSLPHLHTLCCNELRYLGVAALLDIASHSTLEEIQIDSGTREMMESQWIGYNMQFHTPFDVEEDEQLMEQEAATLGSLTGDIEEEDTEALQRSDGGWSQ